MTEGPAGSRADTPVRQGKQPSERPDRHQTDDFHEGTFADGQAETVETPKDTPSGDFARGMRRDENDDVDASTDEGAA